MAMSVAVRLNVLIFLLSSKHLHRGAGGHCLFPDGRCSAP